MPVSELQTRTVLQVYRVRRQIYTQRIRDQNGFGLTKAKLEARIIG